MCGEIRPERGVASSEEEYVAHNTAALLFYNKRRARNAFLCYLCSVSVDQSSSELLSSSASDRSAMGNRKIAATPLSWVSSEGDI